MRLPRYRLRTLIIFIAIVSLGLGVMLRRRSIAFTRIAASHEERELVCKRTLQDIAQRRMRFHEASRNLLEVKESVLADDTWHGYKDKKRLLYLENRIEEMGRAIAELEARAAKCDRQAEYNAKMRSKYEYAASHPWLSVEPDPPEPE